jgi:uroporphyrinogen-III synthase
MGGVSRTAGTGLSGKVVLVTRAREPGEAADAGIVGLLRSAGARPLVAPTIVLHPPSDPRALAQAVARLRARDYGWVAFTSAHAVRCTWDAAGGDREVFQGAGLAVVGPATARALQERGLRADVVAREYRAEGLAVALLQRLEADGGTARVLFPRAARGSRVLPDRLRAAGHAVDVVVAYETRAPEPEAMAELVRELEGGRVDAVVLTSGSTVDNLVDGLGSRAGEWLSRCRLASIGPVTTEAARARGLRVDVVAPMASLESLVGALAESYRETQGSLETATPTR